MAIRFKPGCLYLSLILFVPAIVAAYFLHSAVWFSIIPPGIIVLAVLVSAIVGRKKRIVTAEQFANELERHLLGTEGRWDWDDVTSMAIADERLERIRWKLFEFNCDSLSQQEDKDKLKAIIEALRRGELPVIVPPTHLTYGKR
jgi:hypothetical protein